MIARSSSNRYTVTRCGSGSEFLALRGEWNALLARSSRPYLFLTHEWMSTWWELKRAAGNRELFILVVRGADGITGIAPLVRVTRRLAGLRVRCLALMTMERYAYSPRNVSGSLEFITAGGGDGAVDAVAAYLSDNGSEWDYLRLHPVPEGSETLKRLSVWARDGGYPHSLRPVFSNAVIELPESWEAYLATLSPGFRKKLRYARNSITREGAVKIVEVSARDDARAGFEAMLAIDALSWKQSGGSGLSTPGIREFYEAQTIAAGRAGRLSIWFLELDGKKIAYDLAIVCNGSVEVLKGSYDRTYSRLSPGVVLTVRELQLFIGRGISRVNLLWGDLSYKTKWTKKTEPCHELYVCNRSAAGRAIHAAWIATGLYRGVRFLLNYPERRSRGAGANE